MSIETVLAAGRTAAEARMTSRVAIRRKTGATTSAPNGRKVPAWETVHADLPGRLVATSSGTTPARHRDRDIGGAEVSLASRTLHVPVATSDLRDGDLIEITAGENVGAVFEITEVGWQDQATARRLPVMEALRPEEW